MALGAGSLLAEVAGSMFCPLSLSRGLLRFASSALPTAAPAAGPRFFQLVWFFRMRMSQLGLATTLSLRQLCGSAIFFVQLSQFRTEFLGSLLGRMFLP
jgi:hypothetical protein